MLQGCNIGLGVYAEQALLEYINLYLSDCPGGGHELAVDVGYAYAVGVNDGKMTDAGAYQALGTP